MIVYAIIAALYTVCIVCRRTIDRSLREDDWPQAYRSLYPYPEDKPCRRSTKTPSSHS